jgi:hypothetical protein
VAGCPAGWPAESPPPPPSGEEEEEDEGPPDGTVGGSGGLAGTVFRLHFLGSVEVDEEGGRKRRKRLKKHMVEEAVTKIKVVAFISSPDELKWRSAQSDRCCCCTARHRTRMFRIELSLVSVSVMFLM